MTAGGGRRLAPGVELVQLAPRRCVARLADGGALLLDGLSVAAVAQCLDAAPTTAPEVDAPRGRALADRLAQLGLVVPTAPARAESAPIVHRVLVLGDGALGGAVAAALRALGVVVTWLAPGRGPLPLSEAAVLRDPSCAPRRAVWDAPAALEASLAAHDLTICALEGVIIEDLLALAERARRARAICLFVLARPTEVLVGPTVVPGAAVCLRCAALARYRDAELRAALAVALPHLGVTRLAGDRGLTLAAAALTVSREALAVLAPRPVPALCGAVARVDLDGDVHVERIAPAADCATCGVAPAPAAPAPSRAAARTAACGARLVLDDEPAALARGLDRMAAHLDAAGRGDAGADHGADHGSGPGSWRQRGLVMLARRGASSTAHAVTSLLDHLRGTCELLDHWGQPSTLARAGLFHSGYGTATFHDAIFAPWERPLVRAVIGDDAELLVFLFCALDRAGLRAALEASPRIPGGGVVARHRTTGAAVPLPAVVCAALLTVELANLVEQAHAGRGAPSVWVARARRWCELIASVAAAPPLFSTAVPPLCDRSETRARDRYLDAVAAAPAAAPHRRAAAGGAPTATATATAIAALEEVVTINPFVGEPHLVLASCLRATAPVRATQHAHHGLDLLRRWGSAWDKRFPHRTWTAWGESLCAQPLPIAALARAPEEPTP